MPYRSAQSEELHARCLTPAFPPGAFPRLSWIQRFIFDSDLSSVALWKRQASGGGGGIAVGMVTGHKSSIAGRGKCKGASFPLSCWNTASTGVCSSFASKSFAFSRTFLFQLRVWVYFATSWLRAEPEFGNHSRLCVWVSEPFHNLSLSPPLPLINFLFFSFVTDFVSPSVNKAPTPGVLMCTLCYLYSNWNAKQAWFEVVFLMKYDRLFFFPSEHKPRAKLEVISVII